jgi:hypothetical protein
MAKTAHLDAKPETAKTDLVSKPVPTRKGRPATEATPVSEAASRLAHWRENPLNFVRANFQIEPDEWQREVLEELGRESIAAKATGAGMDHGTSPTLRRRHVMKACTGPGKSAVLAWLAWWRLSCFGHKGEHPKGAALSITADNLKDNLWAEINKWQTRSAFLRETFTWTKERVFANDYPATWFLSARAFSKDADSEAIGRTLSGLHSQYAFVILDEVGEMPIQIGRSAEQAMSTGIDIGIFAAGNPTSTSGLLYHLCTSARAQWKITTITADPDDPKRTPRVDASNAREQIEMYGRDNPWVMSTILGLFPPGSFNALLSLDEAEAASKRHLDKGEYQWSQKRLGIDVARFGDDRTVIFPRQGMAAFMPVIMRGADGPTVASRVAVAKNRWGSEMELVDGTGGYGGGVVDALRQASIRAVEVQFAGRANDPRYLNKRAEMWFMMADWVKKGGCLPNIPELVRELTSVTYSFQGGKFQLEAKEQLKKRLGFSPDLADALALTFGIPEMPAGVSQGMLGEESKKVSHDYDPFN